MGWGVGGEERKGRNSKGRRVGEGIDREGWKRRKKSGVDRERRRVGVHRKW